MSEDSRRAKLTGRLVDAAKPETKRYVIWDAEKKGFGVRIETSGLKSFIVSYRTGAGGRNATRREMVLGRVSNMTVESARKEAGRVLNKVDSGEDPAVARHLKRREMDVSALCALYLKEGVDTKKATTIAIDRGRIERHIKPILGSMLVSEVESQDVKRFMRDVANGKTAADIKTKLRGRAIVEGGKGTASRTVGLLGGIFSFAVAEKLRPDNPVRGVQRFPDQKGERFLTSGELTALGKALQKMEADGANAKALSIIRLLAYTGARKGEIQKLKWPEVDFEHSCLRLADSKTGAKIVPLGPPALAVLAAVKKVEGTDLVFPSENGNTPFQGTERVWQKLRKAAGMPDLRLHDLRHSFASAGILGGDNLAILGKLLGHKDTKTTARYAHLADDPVKQAAARISGNIAAAFEGRPEAMVLPLRRR